MKGGTTLSLKIEIHNIEFNRSDCCVREAESSNLSLAKSYTALQTVRHRFNIYAISCVALAL